jgi:hypothetical protein
MKVQLESTTRIVNANGINCRVWEGTTESGIRVQAMIPRIAAQKDQDLSEFEAELQEQRQPSADFDPWPLRMVL